MNDLTPEGARAVEDMARRYGVSVDAVKTMLYAVNSGGGTMAQFHHPELGGSGQWMRGGMTMVGDMFNYGLQAKVVGLCQELSQLLATTQVIAPLPSNAGFGAPLAGNNWWPGDLGFPSSSGGQNDMRYAVFPQSRRLAISQGGQVSVYDTLDHQIGGVQQQSGGGPSFSSQYGTVYPRDLPLISGPGSAPAWAPAPPVPQAAPQAQSPSSSGPSGNVDVFASIERLAALHRDGILSDSEFSTKKAELLARL